MNQGSNPPSGGQPGGKGRRRRRGRRGPVTHGIAGTTWAASTDNNATGLPSATAASPAAGQAGPEPAWRRHLHRAHGPQLSRGPGQQQRQHAQARTAAVAAARPSASSSCRPIPSRCPWLRTMQPARIFAFVDDLFFLAKIQETARKMNVKVEFVKTEKDLYERMGENGNDKPSLIIVDLNNVCGQAAHHHSQAEEQAEEGHQHHRLRLARAGRTEDEGARKPDATWWCRARRFRRTWRNSCAATAAPRRRAAGARSVGLRSS